MYMYFNICVLNKIKYNIIFQKCLEICNSICFINKSNLFYWKSSRFLFLKAEINIKPLVNLKINAYSYMKTILWELLVNWFSFYVFAVIQTFKSIHFTEFFRILYSAFKIVLYFCFRKYDHVDIFSITVEFVDM